MTSKRRWLAEILIYLAGMIDRERPLLTMNDDYEEGIWVVRYPGREKPVFSIREDAFPSMEWQNSWGNDD